MMNDSDMPVMDEELSVQEPQQPETAIQKKSSFWSRWFGNRHVRVDEVLFDLSEAVEQYPEAPTNYLLRGEYYLQIGYNQLAEEDFQQAVRLAEVELSKREWGFVAQVVRDRANRGLTITHQRLQHSKA